MHQQLSVRNRDRLTTAGSTNAAHPPSSSNIASTKETAADPRSIITSWSLNCSRMSSQSGVGGSSAIAIAAVSNYSVAQRFFAYHSGHIYLSRPQLGCLKAPVAL
jgi:hypothetical protein